MSRHPELARLALMAAGLPSLTWSSALAGANQPTSALVLEWRSPVGHIVAVEPHGEAIARLVRPRLTAVGDRDLAAWLAHPSQRPQLFTVQGSRLVEHRELDAQTLASMPFDAPAGALLSAWLLLAPGDVSPPPTSFLAALLERGGRASSRLLEREALVDTVIDELEDDEAEEHAEDPELLFELVAERIATQERAAEDHLKSCGLRRGLTDVATGQTYAA
jgi:hypothetical protein